MALFMPVQGVSPDDLRDGFGDPRSGGRSHKGLDIFAPSGTPVLAAVGGKVVKTGNSGLGGLRVWVEGDDGRAYYYAHLSSIAVNEGQRVSAGQNLGGVGATGNAEGTSPHLHFSINGKVSNENPVANPYEELLGAQTPPSQQSTAPVPAPQQVQTPRNASRVAVGVLNQLSRIARENADRPELQDQFAGAMNAIYKPEPEGDIFEGGRTP